MSAETDRTQHVSEFSSTMLDDFLEFAAHHPDKAAVVTYSSNSTLPTTVTYGQLAVYSRRVAAALMGMGIEPGDRVSVQLANGWEFPAFTLGALRVGAVVNPIVPIFREREVAFILRKLQSAVFVAAANHGGNPTGATARRLGTEIDTLRHVYISGAGAHDDADFHDRFFDADLDFFPDLDDELDRRRPSLDDTAEIQYTSGTTGEPKGVVHSFGTLRYSSFGLEQDIGLGAGEVSFSASPLGHQTGFLYGMLWPLSVGMKVVFQDSWRPRVVLTVLETERVTFMVSSPAFLIDILSQVRATGRQLSAFKYFVSGGAPVASHLPAETRRLLGADLLALWGMTEIGIMATTRPGDGPDIVSDCDGRAVSCGRIRIVDESGSLVDDGVPGQIEVQTMSQCLGYFEQHELWAASWTSDGWFKTGDLGRRRPDGGIRITGRTKDLIIRGGENIPVVEVESEIMRHPSVEAVAVVPYPDDRLGERVCAVVVSHDHVLSLADITSVLENAGMAKQYWPEMLLQVDELPMTASRKVQKFRVRELVQDHLQAKPVGEQENPMKVGRI